MIEPRGIEGLGIVDMQQKLESDDRGSWVARGCRAQSQSLLEDPHS